MSLTTYSEMNEKLHLKRFIFDNLCKKNLHVFLLIYFYEKNFFFVSQNKMFVIRSKIENLPRNIKFK